MDMETEISELNYEGNLNTLNEVITGTKELELTINNLSNDIVELTKKKENVTQSLMDDKTTNELKAEEMKFVIEDRTKALTYQLNITAELQAVSCYQFLFDKLNNNFQCRLETLQVGHFDSLKFDSAECKH